MSRSIASVALLSIVVLAAVGCLSAPLPLQEDELLRKVQEMQQRIDDLTARSPEAKTRYHQHINEFKQTIRDNRIVRDVKNLGVDTHAIDSFIASQMSCQTLPGLAVVAVKDGQVVYKNTFGTKSASSGAAIDDQTLFGIGSTTKAFTSALVTMLAEKKLVQLDAPVGNYIPGFRLLDPTANELVTVRDLLSHRTGLPRHDTVLFYANMTREDMVYKARYLRPSAQIREAWQYNNWMMMTAGYLAGKVEGLEWEDLVQRDIFDRLNMTTTKPNFASAESVANKANPQYWNGHTWIDAPWDANKIVDASGPAGAINSNLVDMAKWMNFHLQQASPSLLSPAAFLAMHSQQMAIPRTTTLGLDLLNMLVGDAYGLAWFAGNYRGMRHVFHGGDVFGFHAVVSLIPEENFGVTLLTNADNPSSFWREVISSYVTDQVLGLSPLIANSTVGCRFPCSVWASDPECHTIQHGSPAPKPAQTAPSSHIPQTKAPNALGVQTPSDYVGVYANPGYGNMTVSYYNVSDTLYASYGSLVQPLVPYRDGSDMFFAGTPTPVANSNTLTFWRNTQFQVIAATIRIVGDIPYEITFTNSRYTTFDFPGEGFLTGDGIAYLPADKAGPQGPAGATGPTGPTGPAGATGSSSSYSPGAIAGIVLASIFAVSVASSLVAIYLHRRLFGIGNSAAEDSAGYVSMSDDRRA